MLYNILANRKKNVGTGLSAKEYRKFKLVKKTQLTHNTYRFRFALQTPTTVLGLPIGQHMFLRFKNDEGKLISRPYTPVTCDDEKGYFDLVIKVYDQGKMTQHLKAMSVGSYIEVKGPHGHIKYKGNGRFRFEKGKSNFTDRRVKKIGMIAGGTGITPMLQIVQNVIRNNKDKTEISMIFANVTEDDILCKSMLDQYAQDNKNFKVHYTLDRPSDSWKGGKGFVTSEMIQDKLPGPETDCMILLCGPPPMMNFMAKNLKGLDYNEAQYEIY